MVEKTYLQCRICEVSFDQGEDYSIRKHIMNDHTLQDRLNVLYTTEEIDIDEQVSGLLEQLAESE